MKYTTMIVGALTTGANGNVLQSVSQDTKRYNQLIKMMENYNPNFDDKKYWTYGCNCLMLGDRPMSDPGKGKAVDELDATCKRYKDCLKCARMNHGETCLGEFHQYGMRITKNGEALCRNDEGSCERALCECDAMFAREHVAASAVYTDDNHMFYSKTGWNPEEECIAGGGSTDPKCCGTPAGPYFLFNGNNPNKKCCADGTVKADCNAGGNNNDENSGY